MYSPVQVESDIRPQIKESEDKASVDIMRFAVYAVGALAFAAAGAEAFSFAPAGGITRSPIALRCVPFVVSRLSHFLRSRPRARAP